MDKIYISSKSGKQYKRFGKCKKCGQCCGISDIDKEHGYPPCEWLKPSENNTFICSHPKYPHDVACMQAAESPDNPDSELMFGCGFSFEEI